MDWDSVKLGDSIQFEVKVKLPSPKEWGTDNNYSCFIEDIIGDRTESEDAAKHRFGLEINQDVAIKINGKPAVAAGQTNVTLSDQPGDIIRVEYQGDRKQFSIRFGNGNQDGESDGSLAFLKLHAGAELTINYTATMIQRAEETPKEINTAILHYGNKKKQDSAYVYDFTIVVNKNGAEDNAPLDGAKFVLMNEEGKFYCSDVKTDDSYHAGNTVQWLAAVLDTKTGQFTPPTSVPDGVDVNTMIKETVKNNWNGQHHFEGVAEGRYFLYEIEAPQGYTRMTEAVIIEIEPKQDGNGNVVVNENETVSFLRTISRGNVTLDANGNMLKTADGKVQFTYTQKGTAEEITSGGVPWGGEGQWDQLRLDANVVNSKETFHLPETGGIGTTIFYAVGGALLVGAVVLLAAKRRADGTD